MAGLFAWPRSASATAGTRPATRVAAVNRTAGRRTGAPTTWAGSQTGSPSVDPLPAVQRDESPPGSGDASLNARLVVERLGGRPTGHARRSVSALASLPGAFSMNRALVASVALASLAAGGL